MADKLVSALRGVDQEKAEKVYKMIEEALFACLRMMDKEVQKNFCKCAKSFLN